MRIFTDSPNIRKGQFLWMDPVQQKSYLEKLRKKIADHYFASDAIITKIVEEMAPVFSDSVERELPFT